MHLRALALPSFIALAALTAAACSSDSGETVKVTATNTACTPEKTTVPAKKVSFEVKNDGNDVTELYVQTKDDKVLGEVENVGPGTSRKLTVTLQPGEYKLVCKPGQKGDGITASVTAQ
jgi:iron uptake system component EfeO